MSKFLRLCEDWKEKPVAMWQIYSKKAYLCIDINITFKVTSEQVYRHTKNLMASYQSHSHLEEVTYKHMCMYYVHMSTILNFLIKTPIFVLS